MNNDLYLYLSYLWVLNRDGKTVMEEYVLTVRRWDVVPLGRLRRFPRLLLGRCGGLTRFSRVLFSVILVIRWNITNTAHYAWHVFMEMSDSLNSDMAFMTNRVSTSTRTHVFNCANFTLLHSGRGGARGRIWVVHREINRTALSTWVRVSTAQTIRSKTSEFHPHENDVFRRILVTSTDSS